MIKRIELWDFESHEHTEINDISPELNLICGESNSGKTSIVRAIKLVAYNEFDPKSVRVGAKNCRVLVETERGTVKVTRGPKDNLWETTRVGETTRFFDKVGQNVVPEAEEIVGLKIVTLGDIKIPVNVMDQLESHFMLSGIGDKNASGSMRAQIIDEISGLSGIEGVIKSVSLDQYRFGREITDTEKHMEEVKDQLYPEDELDKEELVLSKTKQGIEEYEMLDLAKIRAEKMLNDGDGLESEIEICKEGIDRLPDVVLALSEVKRVEEFMNDVTEASGVLHQDRNICDELKVWKGKLNKIPDVDKAQEQILIGMEKSNILLKAVEIHKDYETNQNGANELFRELKELDSKLDGEKYLGLVQKNLDNVRGMVKTSGEWLALKTQISLKSLSIESRMQELKELDKEITEILDAVTTCPFTLRPITDACGIDKCDYVSST